MEYKKYALPKEDDAFEDEWKRSVSIEEFRMQCKNQLNEIYG